jgi:tRNA dimethylallyltransferase
MTGPVVFVVGATGTGKTDLSLAIARECHGEIVNADALQVYAGLDIATNKASAEERGEIPHHLLGSVPSDAAITVHECGAPLTV